jgi:hypothetical protein
MAITINGTTGITSAGGYTGDGVVLADNTPANTLVTTTGGDVGIGIAPVGGGGRLQVSGLVVPSQLTVNGDTQHPARIRSAGAAGNLYFGQSRGIVVNGSNNGGSIYIGGDGVDVTAAPYDCTAAIEASWGDASIPQLGMAVVRDGYRSGIHFFYSGQTEIKGLNGGVNFRVDSSGVAALRSSNGVFGNPIVNDGLNVFTVGRAAGYLEWLTDIGAVGTTYFVSDIRKKENIAPSTFNSSAIISGIEFIEFDWKPKSGNEGHVDVGVSAQQLQQLDNRLVNELSDGSLMVNEPALVAHMAKAIQEQQALITQLQADVAALKGAA